MKYAVGLLFILVGGWAIAYSAGHWDAVEKTVLAGTRQVTVAELVGETARAQHLVALRDFEFGEPVTIASADEPLQAYIPVYSSSDNDPRPAVPPLLLDAGSFATRAALAERLSRHNADGTIANGLSVWDGQFPPEVQAAYPGISAESTLLISRGVEVPAALAGLGGVAFALLGVGILFLPAQWRWMPKQSQIPKLRPLDAPTAESAKRTYIHELCRQPTDIAGRPFVVLENPFQEVEQCYCVACRKHFSIYDFYWADTAERLVDYRNRLFALVTRRDRMRFALSKTIYEGAINLGLDENGHIVQPLIEPPAPTQRGQLHSKNT